MNKNVQKVFSYEIIPNIFKEAKVNIEKSPFKDKIELFNAGVSDKNKIIRISKEYNGFRMWFFRSPFGFGGTNIEMIERKNGIEVPLITLNSILKNKENVVIKSDCEGAEGAIFNDADLSNVYAIQLEYHNCKKEISTILESKGFKVEDLNPNLEQGLMYAWK